MKKRICFLLLLFLIVPVLFSGCGKDFVSVNSKNVDEYSITIDLDEENHKATCTQNVNYINNSSTTLNNIMFHLYANAFSSEAVNKPVSSLYENKAYYNGFSEGKIEINSLKVNDEEIEICLAGTDKTLLDVKLRNGLNSGERVNVEFKYELTIPNINHRFGYGENTINLGNFYPIASVFDGDLFNENGYHYNGDPFYSNISNYEIVINHNKEYIVASSGKQISKEINGETAQTKLSAKAVRDFALVVSNKFNVVEQKLNGTTISYFYYNDENSEKSLETCKRSVETFNELFGYYPYETLCVVESNFVHGGMEFPSMVLISDNLDTYEDYTQTIIHEIAHEWWYAVVGNDQFSCGWLDEGLAEFSTALFFEKNADYNVKYEDIISNARSSYSLFVEVYTDVFGNVDTSMNRKLNEYKTEPEYVYIAYVKGMLLFDSLRDIVSENKLLKGLKKYYKENQGRNATPGNLIYSLEKATGYKLQEFFDSWIDGKVVI